MKRTRRFFCEARGEQLREGSASRCIGASRRSGRRRFRVVAVHRERRLANQDAATGGRRKRRRKRARASSPPFASRSSCGRTPKWRGQSARRCLVLRIHGDLLAVSFGQARRTEGEQPEVFSLKSRRSFFERLQRALRRCGDLELPHAPVNDFHRRTLTALRCAIKPSDSARVSSVWPRQRKPLRVMDCTLMHFTKSRLKSPRAYQPSRPVGRTWLLPLA